MMKPPVAQRKDLAGRGEGSNCHRSVRWRKFRFAFLVRNPICQKILEDGRQCHEPATIVHHMISPLDRPDLQFSASNCRAVCAQHHPNTRGEPNPPNQYVETVGMEVHL